MNLHLPLHPSKRHPITGEPLRALYVDRRGVARYPIMGGSTDPNPAPDPEPPAATDPPAAPPVPEPPKDKGFPEGTPVADMTPPQQAAYQLHQARKHEARATEYREAVGGKTAAEVKADLAELERLRTEALTDSEKQVNQAKVEGRREAALTLAPQLFDVALAHVDAERRQVLIDTIDLSKVVSDTGEIDTAKVKTIAESLAPADKEPGNQQERRPFDFGGGPRGGTDPASGVSAGRDLFKARRGKSSTTTT